MYVKMIRTLHEDGGAEIVDAVHSCVVQKLTTSLEWQEESLKHGMAFEECWDRVMATPALGDEDTVDAIAELATTHARNIKMPNFARWMTVFPALKLFLDNWTIIYFIAAAIKQTLPRSSSLSQYACTLIRLMNAGSGPPSTQLKEGECPPIYAEGLFVRGFGNACFGRHF